MTTSVSGWAGTACRRPKSVASLSPGQKAYSERCRFWKVSDRPTPRPPAVITRMALSSQENCMPRALLEPHRGRSASGRWAYMRLVMENRLAAASSVWGHNAAAGVEPGGRALEQKPLGQRGKAHLPRLQNNGPHGLARLVLGGQGIVQLFAGGR